MLRDLVDKAQAALESAFPDAVHAITKGGSFGIWQITATPADVQANLPKIRADLAAGHGKHLGFGLVAVADDGADNRKGFAHQRLRLRAALQLARVTEARLPYPNIDEVETGANAGVCPIDLVRPIATKTDQKIERTKTLHTSQAVYDRRSFGIKAKQTLLGAETLQDSLTPKAKAALLPDIWPLAMQIGSISEQTSGRARLKSNLAGKICVIALDGNGFGKVQDDALAVAHDQIATQKAFDATLSQMRRRLVTDVFNLIIDEGCQGAPCAEEVETRAEIKKTLASIVRFELLLWGGDEIMFIVPARVGWKVMEQIGTSAAGMKFDAASLALSAEKDFADRPVTFSVSAVFCHHDAPIARIKSLADDLCGHIKRLKPEGGDGRDGKADTLFMAEVLESFDHIGMDLDGHLDNRTPKKVRAEFSKATRAAFRVMDLVEAKALRQIGEVLARGKGGDLSRGRLRQTAFALHRGAVPGAEYVGDKWVDYLRKSSDALKNDAKKFAEAHFGIAQTDLRNLGQARLFTLLEEYWDYLTPEKQAQDDQAAQLAEVAL